MIIITKVVMNLLQVVTILHTNLLELSQILEDICQIGGEFSKDY